MFLIKILTNAMKDYTLLYTKLNKFYFAMKKETMLNKISYKLNLAILCGLLAFSGFGQEKTDNDQQIDTLAATLNSKGSVLARRRAVRELAKYSPKTVKYLEKAVNDSDAIIRVTAIKSLCQVKAYDKQTLLEGLISDQNSLVRLTTVKELAGLQPRTEKIRELLNKMRNDDSSMVKEIANKALFPFFRENITIRNRVDYDYEVHVSKEIDLPLKNCKYQLDKAQKKHLNGCYKVDFNDSDWLGSNRENTDADFRNVVWYRQEFKLPTKPEGVATELHFEAICGDTWVWLNGIYIGQYTNGVAGTSKALNLDVSKEVKWGEDNQLTVRTYGWNSYGKICKNIKVQVLK
jgi:uncharacterized protein YaaR (DUF327 family)